MSHRFTPVVRLASLLTLVLMCFAQGAQTQAAPRATSSSQPTALFAQQAEKFSGAERAMYIIQLEGEPLASYAGGISGLPATSPSVTGSGKLNLKSSAASAYRAHLAKQRNAAIASVAAAVGHPVEVPYIYDAAYNGFALERQVLKWVIPYHDGAIRYFKEKGVWKDEHQKHNDALVRRQDVLQKAWDRAIGEASEKKIPLKEFSKHWMQVRAGALREAGLEPYWEP